MNTLSLVYVYAYTLLYSDSNLIVIILDRLVDLLFITRFVYST